MTIAPNRDAVILVEYPSPKEFRDSAGLCGCGSGRRAVIAS